MDLEYSPEHRAFRDEVRAFLDANRDKAPNVRNPTPGQPNSAKALAAVADRARLRSAHHPARIRGLRRRTGHLENRIIAEEFSAARVPPGNSGDNRLVPTVLELGTEEQKRWLVPPSVRGEMSWCQGYSEPGSGSDLASLSTKAELDGDEWVINGQKIWTSGAQNADMMFCLVRTEPDAPKHNGISYLVFSMDTPGIDVRPLVTMTGDAFFNEVFFTDVRVPKDQIIGKRGEGWFVANTTLRYERGGLGDSNEAETRFNRIVDIMQRETVGGERLIDNPIYATGF